ncbi:bifunctional demethylmenaquinone methyltransferase/2-methoxy-6-polyprenyl-1,4-benzoquinol methylase UbiE [Frateuria aurantia]
MSKDTTTTHFGFRDVPVGDKQRLVGEVFTSVASNYDLMNDLMSMGIHRLWKRHFALVSGVRRGDRVLDLAGGTGDIAALLLPLVGHDGEIVVGDINAAMLEVGRDRLTDRGLVDGLRWARMNAEILPFPDASFDAVTMVFGLRNVTNKAAALADIYRVLKPGGRALIMEFSKVKSPLLAKLYDFHSFQVLPRLGKLFAGDADSYQYLAESIRKHPDQEGMRELMLEAGYDRVDVRNLSHGIVAIHRGYKF